MRHWNIAAQWALLGYVMVRETNKGEGIYVWRNTEVKGNLKYQVFLGRKFFHDT